MRSDPHGAHTHARSLAVVLAVAATATVACQGSAAPTEGERRLVVVSGALTEIVFALGVGADIVGVDRTSLWPDAAAALPKVGMPGSLSVEGVLALRPTLVLVDPRTPQLARDQLAAAGVKVVPIGDEATVPAAKARTRELGALLGREAEAEAIVATLARELAEAQAIVATATARPRALFIYARGHRTLLAGGRESPADAILGLAGADNVMTEVKGFQPVSAEAIVDAAPDVIVIPTKGLESLGGVDGLLQVPGLAATPAGRARRIVAVDDLELLGFGPRLGRGVTHLARALHATPPPSEAGP